MLEYSTARFLNDLTEVKPGALLFLQETVTLVIGTPTRPYRTEFAEYGPGILGYETLKDGNGRQSYLSLDWQSYKPIRGWLPLPSDVSAFVPLIPETFKGATLLDGPDLREMLIAKAIASLENGSRGRVMQHVDHEEVRKALSGLAQPE